VTSVCYKIRIITARAGSGGKTGTGPEKDCASDCRESLSVTGDFVAELEC
jgi:hypothetical protein